MKSDKARKVTSREYIMKLIYQIEMNKEDIENIEERLDIFLNDNLEYIINRYEELRLQYSNNPNVELNNIQLDDAVDREYMNIICENLKENKDKPILVYCKAGHKSALVCEMLKEEGFTKLYNLGQGILGYNGILE